MASSTVMAFNQEQREALAALGWNMQQYSMIDGIYQKYMNGTDKLVQHMAESWQTLLQLKGGYEMHIHNQHMGVHPANRDGEGLAVDRVHRTPKKVKKAGFVVAIAEHDTYCVEENPRRGHIGKFTEENTAMSPGLGKYKAADVKFGSVGAGHLNNSMQAADQGVPCDDNSISANGRMSKEKITENDPAYASAWGNLRWKVIKWPVEVLFPKFPYLFQSALNSIGEIPDGASMFANNVVS